MFHRNIIDHLKTWKNKTNRKPLIVRGARQVGKTSAILLFGNKYFDQTVHINLEKTEHARLFRQEISVKEFETIINVSFGKKLTPNSTLVFIDEIQEIPHMIKLLRFLWEQKPNIHIIAAGSLFEVKLKQKNFSIPVGRIEFAYMYPLTYFEYLSATSQKQLLNYLEKINIYKKSIPTSLHTQISKSFKEYTLIGGMPEAVNTYIKTRDINSVNAIFSDLLTSFRDDVYKYSSSAKGDHLAFVVEQSPLYSGLSISYEKFANSKYRSREMSHAFDMLSKAMLLYQVRATKSTKLPIVPQRKKPPKLIFLDIGLVNYQMGIQSNYIETKNLSDLYRGRIAEQIVGQHILSSFIRKPASLFYWYKKTGSKAEVDFCTVFKKTIIGIEVKSGSSKKLRSLQIFGESAQNSKCIRIHSGELKITSKLLSLPFYLLPRWKEITTTSLAHQR